MPNCDLPTYYALVFTSLIWLVIGSISKILSLDAKCCFEQILSFITQVSRRTKQEEFVFLPDTANWCLLQFEYFQLLESSSHVLDNYCNCDRLFSHAAVVCSTQPCDYQKRDFKHKAVKALSLGL